MCKFNILFVAAITCPPLPDHIHTSITYSPDTTPSFPYGTQAMYTIDSPEGMERDGGDYIRTCTGDGRSAVGVWSGTGPICTGTHALPIIIIEHCLIFLTAQKMYLLST